MKIGTDAVLLGAWAPCDNETRILDIGTGSGVLALMMAQKTEDVQIDGIEIDPDASACAILNAEKSPWAGRISITNSSLQDFTKNTAHKYSLIICNPPFFTDSLKAPDMARSTARHNHNLPVDELIACTAELLTDSGKAAFIIPASDCTKWQAAAGNNGLHITFCTMVRSYPQRDAHRALLLISKHKPGDYQKIEISIYSAPGAYSQAYKTLTRDFYLKF